MDWKSDSLLNLCNMYQPKTISKKMLVEDGKYLVYGANGVIGHYDQYNHDTPQLLITCRGATCGSVNTTKGKVWINGNAMVVAPKDERLNLRYLEYVFLGGINLSSAISGAAQPQITREGLSPLMVHYPPTSEQKRIVAILDQAFADLEQVRAKTEQNLKNARELFDSYLQQVFSQRGEGWRETTLGSVAKFKNGLNFSQSSKGEELTIVGVKDFKSHFMVPFEQLDTIKIDGDLSEEYELKKNDIITVRSNGNKRLIGRCLLMGTPISKTSYSGFTIRIRLIEDNICPKFLTYYMKSPSTHELLINSGEGANISNLNQKILTALPVTYPNYEQQCELVKNIKTIETESNFLMRIYTEKLDSIDELKKSILQKAFSCELTTTA
jgi:type I restriction enzyme S subunit